MDKKVKQHIINYNKKNNWNIEDTGLVETLIMTTPIHTEILDSHRWYDNMFVVVDIDEMLIGYNWFHITCDMSVSDLGLEFDISSVHEVVRKEITSYTYVQKK